MLVLMDRVDYTQVQTEPGSSLKLEVKSQTFNFSFLELFILNFSPLKRAGPVWTRPVQNRLMKTR